MDLTKYKIDNISNQHMLTLATYSRAEILGILTLAYDLKQKRAKGIEHKPLAGKTLGMIFAKSSTRTRVSFEQGILELGGYGMFLSTNDIQLGRGEPISDTAQVLSRMVHGIMIRTFDQSDVEDLAKYGTIPIINGLTDDYHPCQVLADMLTVYEKLGTLENLKVSFFGDGNNMANSLMIICSKLGIDVYIATPSAYAPSPEIVEMALGFAATAGSTVVVTEDATIAAENADVIYTDVFASMGQEGESSQRIDAMMPYQINANIMDLASNRAIFLHCLPAHRGEEVTAEVIDGVQSFVFDQAENRLHAQKALMELLMKA